MCCIFYRNLIFADICFYSNACYSFQDNQKSKKDSKEKSKICPSKRIITASILLLPLLNIQKKKFELFFLLVGYNRFKSELKAGWQLFFSVALLVKITKQETKICNFCYTSVIIVFTQQDISAKFFRWKNNNSL